MVGKGGYTDIQTAWRSHKPTIIFLIKESGPKSSLKTSIIAY
jgi:hypothetical protein